MESELLSKSVVFGNQRVSSCIDNINGEALLLGNDIKFPYIIRCENQAWHGVFSKETLVSIGFSLPDVEDTNLVLSVQDACYCHRIFTVCLEESAAHSVALDYGIVVAVFSLPGDDSFAGGCFAGYPAYAVVGGFESCRSVTEIDISKVYATSSCYDLMFLAL